MILGERIKKVRKNLDLTQQEFGKRIGIKPNSISLIESGNRNASKQVILSICREFNVNETWLRTGSGEMFRKRSRSDELTMYMENLLQTEPEDIRRKFTLAISHLSTEQLIFLRGIAESLVDDLRDTAAKPVDQQAIWEAEARAEAEEVYREILAEKEAAARLSASTSSTGSAKRG